MATRRRIGVSAATTEAARRQLMQPVPCWEQVWVPSDINPNLKVYKWTKTEKVQHFSDEEDDEPLAPLPDDPEIIDGDEEMDQDDTAAPSRAELAPKERTESEAVAEDTPSKAPSPKPQLSMTLEQLPDLGDELDASLKPLDTNIDEAGEDKDDGDMQLDMSGLGPDGVPLEASHDLSQLVPSDGLVGGNMMDQSGDPFVQGS